VNDAKKGKLIIPRDFINKVRYLHKEVGPLEWSGRLIWKLKKGSIENPSSIEVEAVDIIPMDVGNSTYTEFETGDEAIKYFQKYPERRGKVKMGIIHTHHTMQAFFSGTDMGALEDCATADSLLLSLIVNFAEKPVAKIAYTVSETTTEKIKYSPVSKFFQNNDTFFLKNKEVEITKDVLITVDLDIEWKGEDVIKDDYFLDSLTEIQKANTVRKTKTYVPSSKFSQTKSLKVRNLHQATGTAGKQKSFKFPWEKKQEDHVSLANEKSKFLNDQKSPEKIKSSFVTEEDTAIRMFTYMCIWGEDELDENSPFMPFMDANKELFITTCISMAEENYTGARYTFDQADAKEFAEELRNVIEIYYEYSFHHICDDYIDSTLQASIYRTVARTLTNAPVFSFLANEVASLLIELSKDILLREDSAIFDEKSIEEKINTDLSIDEEDAWNKHLGFGNNNNNMVN
jgi:proteasome lid subunit RPN8/RPN11